MDYDKSLGIAEISWLAPRRIESLVLHGTGRSVYVSVGPNLFLEISPNDLAETSLWKSSTRTLVNTISQALFSRGENVYQKEIDYFVDCVRKRRKPLSDAAAGLRALAVAEAAKESMQKKTKIHVPSVEHLRT